MGYILPVNSYTYSNYHQRALNSGNSPYYISRKHPVTFQEIMRDAGSETYSLAQIYMGYDASAEPVKMEREMHGMRFNGKGQNVNISI